MTAIALKQKSISSRHQHKKPPHSPKPRITAEEYLAQERQAEYKSEYFDCKLSLKDIYVKVQKKEEE